MSEGPGFPPSWHLSQFNVVAMVPLPSTPGSRDHHLFTRLSEELMSCETVGSAGRGEEEWAALEASKPSERILIKARSQSPLCWGERGRRGADRKACPERNRPGAIAVVGVLSSLHFRHHFQVTCSLQPPADPGADQHLWPHFTAVPTCKTEARKETDWVAGPGGKGSSP